MNSESHGTVVFVDGVMVAWFAKFDHAAEDWCIDTHYGNWLTYPASMAPVVAFGDRQVEAIVEKLKEVLPEAHR